MERPKSNIIVETGGEGTEETFGIGNLGFILKVLRGKMYANPIKAICREISSNSRDAHREVGKDDLPIEISLPNSLDPHIRFKDYGPGISPDRMSNVFILYGNTTKDSDNVQTGGFGLGAKTPFAYADQFSIITTTEELVNEKIVHIKRNYIAYIDPSEAGKMRCVSTTETNEPCGTEISIFVSEDDRKAFTDAAIEVTEFWDVKPKLSGKNPLPKYREKSKALLEGNGWNVPAQEESRREGGLAIVDGISYPIDSYSLNIPYEEQRMLNYGIRFYFGVGELTLSSNREQLQYDNNTTNKIKEKLQDVRIHAEKFVEKRLANCKTLREAYQFYSDINWAISGLIPKSFVPIWNGIDVSGRVIFLNIAARRNKYVKNGVVKGVFLDSYSIESNDRLYKNSSYDVFVLNNSVLYINDLSTERISRTRVRKILENTKENGIRYVQVLTFDDGDVDAGLKRCQEANEQKIDLRQLNIHYLSDVPLPEKEKKTRKPRNGRGRNKEAFSAFKFDSSYVARRSCDCEWRPEEIDKNTQEPAWYVILEGHKKNIISGNLNMSVSWVRRIRTFIDEIYTREHKSVINIYGIHSQDINKIGKNWVPLGKVFKEVFDAQLGIQPVVTLKKIRVAIQSHKYTMDKNFNNHYMPFIRNGISFIENNDSIFKQYWDASCAIEKEISEHKQLWGFAELLYPKIFGKQLKNEQLEICAIQDRFLKRYPLIKNLDTWDPPPKEAFFEYINLIDEKYSLLENKTVDNETGSVRMVANG